MVVGIKRVSQLKNGVFCDLGVVFLTRICTIKIIKSKLVSGTRLPWQLIWFYNNYLFFRMIEVHLFVGSPTGRN